MAEQLIPPWIVPEEETQEWLDEGSSVFAAEFAPGLSQRQSYGGLRLKLSRKHTVRGEEKAQLLSILKSTKGRYNALRTKVHFALRGSFPATERLSNNTFANGTTGWSSGSQYSLSSADRLMRLERASVTAAENALFPTAAATVTQYAPYVATAFTASGRGSFNSTAVTAGSTQGGNEYGSTIYSELGMMRRAFAPSGTSAYIGIEEMLSSGVIAGDYFTTPYLSLSRCPLVDNGTNALLRSDAFSTSPWASTRVTVSSDNGSTVAPDGTSTADSIVEDSSASTSHFVAQDMTVSASIGDYCFTVALKAGARSWALVRLIENTGSTALSCYFNLSTGALGTASTGANWSNERAFTTAMGNGWYSCTIVGFKNTAATSVSAVIFLATGDGGASYTGNGTSNIYAWRATFAQSSVPTRLIQTTSAASTGTSQTGNALHIIGLPESTNGLLLPEDFFEINGELKQCTAALNSDAAGLGYLQFEPGLIRSPADNDPIIITDPMGKFLVSNLKVDNEFGTQAIVTYDLEHIYE